MTVYNKIVNQLCKLSTTILSIICYCTHSQQQKCQSVVQTLNNKNVSQLYKLSTTRLSIICTKLSTARLPINSTNSQQQICKSAVQTLNNKIVIQHVQTSNKIFNRTILNNKIVSQLYKLSTTKLSITYTSSQRRCQPFVQTLNSEFVNQFYKLSKTRLIITCTNTRLVSLRS